MKLILLLAISIAFLNSCETSITNSLKTVANSKHLKTGFFLPKLPEDINYGNPKRISDPSRLMDEIGFKYIRNPGDIFLVATTAEGENILVVSRAERSPAPLASIDAKGAKFFWSAAIISDSKAAINLESNLFIRHATDEIPERRVAVNGDSSNMYFVRTPTTNDLSREPMLINWVDHIIAEGNLLYRVGNYVYQQGHETPILRFHEIGNQVWQLQGLYSDRYIKSGSIFWTLDGSSYFSATPGNENLVEWKKQDKDSMDRVGERSKKEIRVPAIVERTLASSTGLSADNSPQIPGIDWSKPYKGTIPLIQNNEVFEARVKLNHASKSTAFDLVTQPEVTEDSNGFDYFFEPKDSPRLTGFALESGKLPGLPVFDPSSGYPYGKGIQNKENWVQIEQPPGSGIYKAAVVQQQGSSSRKVEGYIYDSELNQKKTKLQILDQDGKGGFKPTGVVANLTSEGKKTVETDWSHVEMEKAKVVANQEREAQEAAQAKERFAFKSGEGQARMDAADENYDNFIKQYSLEENLKYAANEAISASAKKLDDSRPAARDFQELLQRKSSETITRIGTEALIDAPKSIANGTSPFNTQRALDSANKTLLDSTAANFIPIKLPSEITKAVVGKTQSVLTDFSSKASNYAVGKGLSDAIHHQNPTPMSSYEKGRKAGEYNAAINNAAGEVTQGVLDIGFAAIKQGVDKTGEPGSIVIVRTAERGAQIARQGLQTREQYNGASSAFIDANQALKPYANDRYNNGEEGQRALKEMNESVGKTLTIPSSSSSSGSI